MSIVVPPSHNENADASGTFNAPRIVSRWRPALIVGALAIALRAVILTNRNFMGRLNSPPDAMSVIPKTFAGAMIGGALGAMLFSPFDFPFSWAGLLSGAALGAAYAIGEHPPS